MAKHHSTGNGRSVRAVLYLRMSSDQQEQSIPAQRAELTGFAKKLGYEIVREYIDEAISGDDTGKRKGFLAMRNDAATGKFDIVLCWDQDRFGRFDILDAGFWIMPFRQGSVRLETIAQGTIDWEDLVGQLIYSVNQMGKAQFLRDLSRNTTRGLLNSAREGKAGTGGPSPYGYRSKDGEVTIVPEEAEVTRLIFREYLMPPARNDVEIDQAIETLQSLGEAFKQAKPEDTKELLSSIVTRIVLFYDHEETASGRKTSEFSHGVIYVRPDAGEGHGTQPGPTGKSTHLIKKGPILERPRRQLVLRINCLAARPSAESQITNQRQAHRPPYEEMDMPSCVGVKRRRSWAIALTRSRREPSPQQRQPKTPGVARHVRTQSQSRTKSREANGGTA